MGWERLGGADHVGHRAVLLLALVAVRLAWRGPVEADASCVAPSPLAASLQSAAVVFVGTVVSTTDGGRRATLRVESVWKGTDVSSQVEVVGSPVSGPFTASSVDRTYQSGQRYLFVPFNDRPPFQDNACSATQPYSSVLDAYAPSDRRDVPPNGSPHPTAAGLPNPYGALLAGGAALAGAGLLWAIMRRRLPRLFRDRSH
jgi:hypothetical protein